MNMMRIAAAVTTFTAIATLMWPDPPLRAQVVEPPHPEPPFGHLGSLKGVKPPLPDLSGIVADEAMAIVLGKALFWDQDVGSDGMACASCHFAAGADNRLKNQFNPGTGDLRFASGDVVFGGLTAAQGADPQDLSPGGTAGLRASGLAAGPNVQAVPEDFPLHRLEDENDRNSAVLYTTNDVFSSAGALRGNFVSVIADRRRDRCDRGTGEVFHNLSGNPVRRVEPRHTPTVINAVFNFRNFWDGRANNVFNGEDPFGPRSPNATVIEFSAEGVVARSLALRNASLASQAVGPPLSTSEMSCAGRIFADIGRKMLPRLALRLQAVSPADSRLGGLRNPDGRGLTQTYSQLVRAAFDPRYWEGTGTWRRSGNSVVADATGYTQEELNFAMFWGIAIMLYESTLVSDASPFDRHFDGSAPFAASSPQRRGLDLFVGKGQCIACHDGPELSKAATHLQAENQENGLVERMQMAQGNERPALYDNGFYNIGVTPTVQDVGLGGRDPFGNPLSFTRQFVAAPFATTLAGQNFADEFKVDPCTFEVRVTDATTCDPDAQLAAMQPDAERLAIDGAMKTPTLRNVGLTAPYFHDGSYATLESVVRFYNRGGNRRGPNSDGNLNDTSGTGPLGRSEPVSSQRNGSNLDPDIVPLGLTLAEIRDLTAFLLTLTDQRVACRKAPFDHPQLRIFDGHNDEGPAKQIVRVLPATGRKGVTACARNSGNLFIR